MESPTDWVLLEGLFKALLNLTIEAPNEMPYSDTCANLLYKPSIDEALWLIWGPHIFQYQADQ